MSSRKRKTTAQSTAGLRIWNIMKWVIYSYARQIGYFGESEQNMRKARQVLFPRKQFTDVKAAKAVPSSKTAQRQKAIRSGSFTLLQRPARGKSGEHYNGTGKATESKQEHIVRGCFRRSETGLRLPKISVQGQNEHQNGVPSARVVVQH